MTKLTARFVTSAAQPSDFPPPSWPEVAIVGRSNVGKSSLINALVGKPGLARTSRTPGRTRLLNWFAIDERFFLVATRDAWRPLIESYLGERSSLAGVVLLIDIRRGAQDEELDFVPWLAQREMPLVVALTKADKLAKHQRRLEATRARQALGLRRDPLVVSATGEGGTGHDGHSGIDALWRAVAQLAISKPRAPGPQ